MKNPSIDFKPLQISDFKLLVKWMNAPHVFKWWNEGEKWTLEDVDTKYRPYSMGYKILKNVKKPMNSLVILINDNPIGYIQYYNKYHFPPAQGYCTKNLPTSLAAIDLYIGELEYVSKGYGPKIIEKLISDVIKKDFDHCFVDPENKNYAAIKAYKKIGFVVKRVAENETLMVRNNGEIGVK